MSVTVTDPHEPPPYDPSDPRDVGTGKDFAADLVALYRAGRLHFPQLAATYSGITSATHDAAQRVRFLRSSTGGEYALSLVDELRELLQVELRRTSLALGETGEALVELADDYSTTDQVAHDHFRDLLERKANQIDSPYVPSPPGLDAPYTHEYDTPPLPEDAPAPLPPSGGHPTLPPVRPELDDVVPEEPTQEHAPRPEQVIPWLYPPGYESPTPAPTPEPEWWHDNPFGGPNQGDGENELHLEDLIETPEEQGTRCATTTDGEADDELRQGQVRDDAGTGRRHAGRAVGDRRDRALGGGQPRGRDRGRPQRLLLADRGRRVVPLRVRGA